MMATTANMSEPGPEVPLTEAAWVALSPSWMGVFQLDEADGEALLVVGLSDGVAGLEAIGASDVATLGSGATVTCVMVAGSGAAGTVTTGAGAGTTGTGTGGLEGAGSTTFGWVGVGSGGPGSGAGAGETCPWSGATTVSAWAESNGNAHIIMAMATPVRATENGRRTAARGAPPGRAEERWVMFTSAGRHGPPGVGVVLTGIFLQSPGVSQIRSPSALVR